MSYFSERALTGREEYSDLSYHGFEEQLLWRYEALKERYEELSGVDAPCVRDEYLSADDYRYAPVGCFKTVEEVYIAMEIAKEELWTKCKIAIRDDGSIENAEEDQEDPDQISVFEIVLLPTWFMTAAAA